MRLASAYPLHEPRLELCAAGEAGFGDDSNPRKMVCLVRVGEIVDGQLIVARGRAALGATVACEADADPRCVVTVLAALVAQVRLS